ncbi:MAG: hypothetical protein AB1640_05605 [bacterium]
MPEGGFLHLKDGLYGAESTAWAAIALEAYGYAGGLLDSARQRLKSHQLPDGRVSISPDHPDAYWLTAPAVLAWTRSPGDFEPKTKAVHFLLGTSGRHWPRDPQAPVAHDTELRGWPWTAGTHSWTEPTALALIALKVQGLQIRNHDRVREAERMLLDRQLPCGGWNYGNTFVFGQELRAMPDCTGLSLDALSGAAQESRVSHSIHYLKNGLQTLRTPRSLAWSLMGLSAWEERPDDAEERIASCLAHRNRFGASDTASLALLSLALLAPRGLKSLFQEAVP